MHPRQPIGAPSHHQKPAPRPPETYEQQWSLTPQAPRERVCQDPRHSPNSLRRAHLQQSDCCRRCGRDRYRPRRAHDAESPAQGMATTRGGPRHCARATRRESWTTPGRRERCLRRRSPAEVDGRQLRPAPPPTALPNARRVPMRGLCRATGPRDRTLRCLPAPTPPRPLHARTPRWHAHHPVHGRALAAQGSEPFVLTEEHTELGGPGERGPRPPCGAGIAGEAVSPPDPVPPSSYAGAPRVGQTRVHRRASGIPSGAYPCPDHPVGQRASLPALRSGPLRPKTQLSPRRLPNSGVESPAPGGVLSSWANSTPARNKIRPSSTSPSRAQPARRA